MEADGIGALEAHQYRDLPATRIQSISLPNPSRLPCWILTRV